MRKTQLKLREIDLSKTTRHGGNGLEVGPTYLVMYNGRFYTGQFSLQYYGLNFNGIYNGVQYDPPHENYSSWQKIWLIENAEKVSKEEEISYAERRRAYAIKHKLKFNGMTITGAAPLKAFFYHPKVDAMPYNDALFEESHG